jgi:hypothetical protein
MVAADRYRRRRETTMTQDYCETVPDEVPPGEDLPSDQPGNPLPSRGAEYAERVYLCLWQGVAREILSTVPWHDQEDLRQEIVTANWQYALRCEAAGRRPPNPDRWILRQVRRLVARLHRDREDSVGYADHDAAAAAQRVREEQREADRQEAYERHMAAERVRAAEQAPQAPVLSIRW